MKNYILVILVLLSVNLIGADKFYKKAYIMIPTALDIESTGEFKVVSLLKDKGGDEIEELDFTLETTFVPEDKENSGGQYRTISLNYILEEATIYIKFAILYKVIGDDGSQNYVALLSREIDENTLKNLNDTFIGLTDISTGINLLDSYDNWDEFPGIELTKNMILSAIVIRDTTENITGETILSDSEGLTGDTGGINPGEGANEFIIKSNGVEVVDGGYIKDNKGNLDENFTLGYYIGDYISFKPHKHNESHIDNDKRIVIQLANGETKELSNDTSTEINLDKDSEVRIWNDTGANNGNWYFTITKGNIVNASKGKLTIVEDRGSSIKEVVQMESLEERSSYKRISNVNMTNSLDGEVYFDITDIHE